MRFIKYLMSLLVVCVMIPGVFGYKNGDRITDIGATIPVDGITIRITLPQGEYPANSKALLYAQTNVYCPVPGMDLVTPTPDKNPYKLAAEYRFTESDIEALKNGAYEVVTTLKFNPECGGLEVLISATEEKAPSSIVDKDRPSGGTESEEGEKLTVYASGTVVPVTFKYNDGFIHYTLPQGSYTLGDYIVVSKDDTIVASFTILENMMNLLVNNAYSGSVYAEGLSEKDELVFFVSDMPYEVGDSENVGDLTKPEGDVPTDKEEDSSLSPIVVGGLTFLIVLGIGFIYMNKENKRMKRLKNSD